MTNGLSNPNNLGKSTFDVGGIGSNFSNFISFFVEISGYSKQLFHTFLCISRNYHPRGAVDDLMNCCPKAEGNSSSGHPQHQGGDNLTVAQKGLK